MITRLQTLAVCLLISAVSFAQSSIYYEGETINRLDKDDKKYGIWKLYDKEKGIMVVTNMENDIFVSNIDYYQNGKLIVSQDKDEKEKYIFYINSEPVSVKMLDADKMQKVFKENGEELKGKEKTAFLDVLRVKPMYYGGEIGMQNSIKREVYKIVGSVSGTVRLRWKMDYNGFIEDVIIVSTDNPTISEETIKIVKKLPRLQSGFVNGNFIRGTSFITINLNGN